MRDRSVTISVLCAAVLILCWPSLRTVVELGLHDDRYVQIIAAPFLCLFLMYWERDQIFPQSGWAARTGTLLLVLALSTYFVFRRSPSYASGGGGLAGAVFAFVLACMAAFVLCYGLRSLRAAYFPLCCLLLMIPVPPSLMDKFTVGLQHGSAVMSYRMLQLVGIPVFAEGMRISLPGLDIEVAPECSGIRSCLSLALVGLLAARVCLRRNWTRFALVLAIIPIAIFKNAVRISVIASLGAYVNRAFLYGPIHHYGGLVFTPLGVVLFVALLVALQRSEIWAVRRGHVARAIPEATATTTL
jgi:exosortase